MGNKWLLLDLEPSSLSNRCVGSHPALNELATYNSVSAGIRGVLTDEGDPKRTGRGEPGTSIVVLRVKCAVIMRSCCHSAADT